MRLLCLWCADGDSAATHRTLRSLPRISSTALRSSGLAAAALVALACRGEPFFAERSLTFIRSEGVRENVTPCLWKGQGRGQAERTPYP